MIFKNFTVFIIDDDAAVRRSLMLMIEQEAIRVQAFESAETFLEKYQTLGKGCIITDIQMPGMDGLQLQEALNYRECAMPIIFLTGYGTIPRTVRAIKAGAVDFLTKPITRAKLLACIRSAYIECRKSAEASQHSREANLLLSKLTEREREVIFLVVKGQSNKDIATRLGISHRTVEIHRSNIMRKMGATNILELAHMVNECDISDYGISNLAH